jgi:hypothetical protein
MLIWTIYVNGELFDLMTNDEAEDLIASWKVSKIDSERGVIEFY